MGYNTGLIDGLGILANEGIPGGACPNNSTKGFSFNGDWCWDTGMFSPSDGILGLYANGALMMEMDNVNNNYNVGIGGSPSQYGSKLQVAGEIQASNSGAACTTANAGAIRFDSTSNQFLGCNGTVWGPLGSASPFPPNSLAQVTLGTFTCSAYTDINGIVYMDAQGWNPGNTWAQTRLQEISLETTNNYGYIVECMADPMGVSISQRDVGNYGGINSTWSGSGTWVANNGNNPPYTAQNPPFAP